MLRHAELKEQRQCLELSKGLAVKDAGIAAQLERRELDIACIRLELLNGFMNGTLVFCSTPGSCPYAKVSQDNSGFKIESLSSSRFYTTESISQADDIIARVWW